MPFHDIIPGGLRLHHAFTTPALLAAACLSAAPAYGQFSTILNLPPDTIAGNTTIGSDTQVNFFAGGSMGSGVRFGSFDGTSSNIEFNVFGGSPTSFDLYTGATANISGGTINRMGVNDEAVLNITAGNIQDLFLSEGSQIVDISGGTIANLEHRFIFDGGSTTLNISGGSVTSFNGIGHDSFDDTLPLVEQFNLTGGTVNATNTPNFTRNATLTGGTFEGQLIVEGGTGVLDGSTFIGGVSSGGTDGVLTVLSGSAGSVGASYGSTTHVNGDVGLSGLSFTDGGTINLNGGDLNLTQLFIYNNGDQGPSTATLNMNAGTVVIDQVLAEGFGRDSVLQFNIAGSDVSVPGFFSGSGLDYVYNISSGSLNTPISPTLSILPARNIVMTGGRIGNNFTVSGLDDSYGAVILSNGIIGDRFQIATNSFQYQEKIYLNGMTIGNQAGFINEVVMNGGSIGDEAYFNYLTQTGGSVGHDAEIEGTLVLDNGSIGDDLDIATGERATVNSGSVGNRAIFAGLTLNGGTIGDSAMVYNDYNYPTPSLLMTGGSIGNNLSVDAEAQIDAGQIGANATFSEHVQLNGGSIGSNARFERGLTIEGGSVGDGAEIFGADFEMSGGTIGADTEILGDKTITGGTIGDRVEFRQGEFNMSGGVLGSDIVMTGFTTITGGVIGERFNMAAGRPLILHGSSFILDGVDIGSTLSVGQEIVVGDREVWLTGVLDNGTPFDLFLSTDLSNRGVTDYFHFGAGIYIHLTDGHTVGDLNGDGSLTNADISSFVMALTDPDGYAAAHPGLYQDNLGDFNEDGALTNADIAGFVNALVGGGSLTQAEGASLARSLSAVPEPSSAILLGLGGLVLARRRRQSLA